MKTYPTIFIIPTGIGCEIGGFAGDAIPTAKLLASASGCLVTHPNVMNGGSLGTTDERIFYVEGYSLDRFARGEIGLRKVNQQKLGIIFDSSIDDEILLRHLQVADACKATLGIEVNSYLKTDEPLGIIINEKYSNSSGGYIKNPSSLLNAGKHLLKQGITAIAVVTKFPNDLDTEDLNLYRAGKGIDIIAGVEAVISHLISKYLKVPCAHAPALVPLELINNLDPRAAAEEIGYTFLPSVLIGLNKAPDLIDLPNIDSQINLYPNDIKSIVVPNEALGGEAVLACIERQIKVIAVRNKCFLNVNNSLMAYKNVITVENYFEAAGLILSAREGIYHESITRPITSIEELNK